MDRFDFSPLFRSTIGFDRLTRLVDAATRVDTGAVAYPPYNIETTGEDAYRLTMAVAGFSPAELDITVQENSLMVTGKAQKEDEDGGGYLHRGIARRTFERRFSLADHMKVTGASLNNGLLSVDVVREVPEAASLARSKSAPRSRPCSRWSKRRPNRHVERNRPNVETPLKFGGVSIRATGIATLGRSSTVHLPVHFLTVRRPAHLNAPAVRSSGVSFGPASLGASRVPGPRRCGQGLHHA